MSSPPDPPPDRSLGQHFLVDATVARRAADHAEIGPDATVLEIGPGRGVLTRALLERAARVIAIELDRRFETTLGELAEDSRGPEGDARLELHWGDALELPWPRVDALVANLPYGPALPLAFRALEAGVPRSVLLLQRSLAERLVADPGEARYGGVTVRARRISSGRILEEVAPEQFDPPPAVASALLRLSAVDPRFPLPPVGPDAQPNEDATGEAYFRRLLDALFLHRDRPLRAALGALGAPTGRLLGALPRPARQRLADRAVGAVSPNDFGRVVWAAAEVAWPPPETSAADKRRAQQRS